MPGHARADTLPAELLEAWHKEIRALRLSTALWDASTGSDTAELRRLLTNPKADLVPQARDFLAQRVEEKMAGVRFELIASTNGNCQLVLGYRPTRLIDAIWQRFAEEISAAFAWAPKCGRWFLRNGCRSDRQYCSHACQMRFRRAQPGGDVK